VHDRLDDADTRHLLALRSMLVDAVHWAHTASPLQRSTATVLLDGVSERALHLVAVDRGLQIPRNNFDGLLALVVADIAPAWRPSRLPDVRQLHRARNSAQHEGLAPDRDQLAPWAAAVGAFVRSLVEGQFDVDLDRVALTDPVVDDQLRGELEDAAQALAEQRPADSVRASRYAIEKADEVWQRLHGSHGTRVGRSLGSMLGAAGGNDPLDGALRALEREQRLETFAESPAEAVWFAGLSRERPEHLDIDDAERALAFATSWVLAFEAAKESWTPDRRARADRRARLVRAGDGPAYIDSVTQAEASGGGAVVAVRVADVPDEDFEGWAHTVDALLREAAVTGRPRWQLRGDGIAQIRLDEASLLEEQIEVLASALARAEDRLQEDRRSDAMAEQARADAAEAYTAELAALGALPSWVLTVRREAMSLHGPAVVFSMEPVLGPVAASPDANSLADLIRADGRVEACFGQGPGTWAIQPVLEPADLHDLLWSAHPTVQALAGQRFSRDEELRRMAVALSQRAETAIRARRP